MKVEIKKSSRHGKGIFATENIQEGEVILKWDLTNEINPEDEKLLSPDEKKYVCLFDGKYIQMQEPECYINHSCDANSYVSNFSDIAKRDIYVGEEVTGNYNEVSSGGPKINCNCGSDNCMGKIFS